MFSHVHQVILKVTRGCNLACKYCYVLDKPEYNNEEMTDEVFDFILRRWFSETQRPDVELLFHGGEPLRIGKEKFSRFCTKAYQYAQIYNKSLRIGIQTNATLIDDEWMSIFLYHQIAVGTSWDGVNLDTDYRNNTAGLVLEKLKMLKTAGLNRVGALMVLHKGNINHLEESFDALREVGLEGIKINRGVDIATKNTKDSTFELSAEELVDAFDRTVAYMEKHPDFVESTNGEIIRQWIALTDPNFGTSNFEDRRPAGQEAHCYTRFCGGMRNLMEFEPDGTFQFCGRQSVRNEGITGTVFDRDFLELSIIKKQWKYQEQKLESIKHYRCNECPSQMICDGGCISYSHQKLGKPIIDPGTHQYFKKLGVYLARNNQRLINLGYTIERYRSEHGMGVIHDEDNDESNSN